MSGEFDFDITSVSDAIGSELGFGGEAATEEVAFDITADDAKAAGVGQPEDAPGGTPAGDTQQPAGTPAGAPPASTTDPLLEPPKTWRKPRSSLCPRKSPSSIFSRFSNVSRLFSA